MEFCDAGVDTPPLGLGLAALGRPGYINLGHDADLPAKTVEDMRRQAFDVLDEAWAAGVRYFDAARSYGKSEEFLAEWLEARGVTREEVVVGSKWGYTYTAGWRVDNGADPHEVKEHSIGNLDKQWPQSEALLAPHLRLYQIHSATQASGVLANAEVIDGLARLKATRGVKIGLTLSGTEQADTLRMALDVRVAGPGSARLFDSVQATWNVMEQSAGRALVEARDAGLEVIVKEALANGRLTRRNSGAGAAATLAKLSDLAARYGGVEDAPDVDAAALAVVMAQPFRPMVLSGAATPEQLASNARALQLAARLEAGGEEARRMVEEVLEAGVVEPETYWAERAALAWN